MRLTFKITSRLCRLYSTVPQLKPRVCIVGAGPAGFYAVMHLTKNLPDVKVDIIEKLPVPFGLIRYGVAPDHPEVKNVINQFTKVAKQENVNFYGNITLGKDVELSQLRQHYDAVLLTYGAEEDKVFGIENEDVDNVVAARKFVGWYNGHPSEKHFKIDLSGSTAAVLGQGNVALDVARILLSPIDILKKTDITEHALAALSESKIKELYLVGRRGPLQVAFTIKELREQLKLPHCHTVWRQEDFKDVADKVPNLARPRKRLTELMLKSLSEMTATNIKENEKILRPVFFRSPMKFLVDNHRKLCGIELTCTKLIGDNLEQMKCVPTEELEIINCSLAFRSIGYRSKNVNDKITVGPNGSIINDRGRVLDNVDESEFSNLYVAGWLGTGPVGVILHTMGNAFQVAKVICEDLKILNSTRSKGGFEEIRNIISSKNKPIVDWEGWEKIDKFEIEKGKKNGKIREKICDIGEMIKIANM